MNQDFLATEAEEMNTTAPDVDEAAAEAKDNRTWKNDAGEEVSKSEFIREQFLTHNKSRKDISEEFDINYRTVYGATVNMTNEAEPATRGRAAANQKINVTADGDVVSQIDGVYHINNEAVEDADAEHLETEEVERNEWVREQVTSGVSRGDVAAKLGLSYGVVYGITKDVAGASQRHEVEYNGKVMSRSEYIRTRFQEGVTKADIAKELEVDYPVVWSALKSLKSEAEKFADAVDRLAKYEDKVADGEALKALLEELKGLEFKEEQAEAEATAEAESAASTEE